MKPVSSSVAVLLFASALAVATPSRADDQWQPSVASHLEGSFRPTALAPAFTEQAPPGQQPVHPAPPRTGFKALAKDTAKDFIAFPKRKSTWVILGIGLGAAGLAHPIDDYVQDHIQGSDVWGKVFAPGKYIGSTYVQIGASLGIYLVGRYVVPSEGESRTNKWSHLGLDLIRAQIVSQVLVQGIKHSVRRDRPTGECCAFPSGHAATAFAAASVLERHFGYRFAWPTVLGSFYVAASRLHENQHFLSDVIFGSAVGIATGWTVVGRHGRDSYALLPVPTHGGVVVTLVRVRPAAERNLPEHFKLATEN